MWLQRQIALAAKPRGLHWIADEVLLILSELKNIKVALTHFFVQHNCASLSLNENADASVCRDLEAHFNMLSPEGASHYEHLYEGADEMPAHIKLSLLGCALSIPVHNCKLMLGTWQGLVLGEHRDVAGSRCVVATLHEQCNEN
ncbi:MAG: secondary thiamine-phosphate synthase enzyme [Pseudohongiellaceae bacterium]|jgi:secondary thiamine-phosphate synthase enzyme